MCDFASFDEDATVAVDEVAHPIKVCVVLVRCKMLVLYSYGEGRRILLLRATIV